ncbi:MAG: 3-dehydroquinate synthase [Bacteroidetes bacterium RIFCSPHIGHO2_02_FULL_44_7]|nr:MAG: 3-dehydroquinate synthase [Bacteroidetes bacterium RIFCSPHIGHO2_02_FULL_44_7]
MRYIEANGYSLEVGSLLDSSFAQLLEDKYAESKKIIIVDENTHEYCLEFLVANFDALSEAEVIQVPAGEDTKQISMATQVWEALSDYEVSRYDVIINVGGGVITDFGGFVASCYKRGCDFINIPTSLLAMVDASIGGKTGVNLGGYKNQLGVFSNPVGLYIDPEFLETLPAKELESGFGEMLKHGLIADEELYRDVCALMKSGEPIGEDVLIRCIEVKNKIVREDPNEKGLRKILNFGHTIGHAIEGHYLNSQPLTHGHAIALGMVMEAYLSVKVNGLAQAMYLEIEAFILDYYRFPKFSDEDIQAMLLLVQNDKKNRAGKVLCSLIPEIGRCTYDIPVRQELFLEVFLHFKNQQLNLN